MAFNLKKFLFVVSIFMSSGLLAQPGKKPCGQKGNPCPQVPITGIEYLIGLGGLYGARKIFLSNRSKKKTKEL